MTDNNHKALLTYLEPLDKFFLEDGVTEIIINKPKQVWIEKYGKIRMEEVTMLDFNHLKSLAKLIAQSTNQIISNERPLLSATLPSGYRVQIVIPPACDASMISFAIRKPQQIQMTLEDYEKNHAFESILIEDNHIDKNLLELNETLKNKKIKEFFRKAIGFRKNIIISGGTSTGKTTFTNTLLHEIPLDERLITVEDTREINLPHDNKMHLVASKGDQGLAKVTTQDLIETCLRLRPDRIIVGELRGAEAFSFLRAINTGHPGSISTLHADTPLMAIEQLKLMVLQAGLGINAEQIRDYILQVVDIIVQLKRSSENLRFVSEICFTENIKKNL